MTGKVGSSRSCPTCSMGLMPIPRLDAYADPPAGSSGGFPTRVRRRARVSSRVDGIDPGGGLQDRQAVPRLQDCPERAVSRRKGRGRAPCGAAELHDRRSGEVLGPGVLQRPTLSGVPSVGGIPDTAYESRGGRNQDESSLFARIGGFSRTLSAPLNPPPVVHDGGGYVAQQVAERCSTGY
jgi:hypothetical protein